MNELEQQKKALIEDKDKTVKSLEQNHKQEADILSSKLKESHEKYDKADQTHQQIAANLNKWILELETKAQNLKQKT